MKHGIEALGSLARWCAERRQAVVVTTVVVAAILGAGILQLEFVDDPVSALPRDNPHTEAARALVDEFPGASYASAVFVTANPDKWGALNDKLQNRMPFGEANGDLVRSLNNALEQGSNGEQEGIASPYPGPDNITDEVYMRAMEELHQYLAQRVPELRWGITLSSQVKLVNYTNSGVPGVRELDPSTFTLPGTSPEGAQQFNTAWQTYWAASLDSIRSITSPDWTTTRLVFLMEPGDKSLNEVGADVDAAIESYKEEVRRCDAGATCQLGWNAFAPEQVVFDPRVATSAAAYLTKTTLEDLVVLGPLVAVVIGATLFLAFRRPGTVMAMVIPMGLAGVGVLGIFGLTNIPIHSVSLLVFPVLMGNGIDFAIHMASAYHNARLGGKDPTAAAAQAGKAAGTPLFIATMTTLAGMLLLVFAPNTMLSQLGLAIIMGMLLLLAVSLTTLPAALTWTRSVETRQGWLGQALQRNARFWHHNKALGFVVVVALVAGSVAGASRLETLVIGTPAAYFPEGDEHREDFDQTNEDYFQGNDDLVTNILVLRGDLSSPQAMELLKRLEQEIRQLDFVRKETVVSMYFALNAWIQVREGTAGAPAVIAQESVQEGSTFPDDQEGIRALMDEMFATPLATYASFFTPHPEYDMGTLVVEIDQQPEFEGLEEQWDQVWQVVDRVADEVEGHNMQIHMAGATAYGYLFTKEELPYLQIASLVGLGFTGFLVLAIRRSARDALSVAMVVGASGLWWVGLLAAMNIPLSVVLVVPVVMIAAIGSDYALHMRYGLGHDGSRAWSTVGRAVFFSALTDLAAFLVFAQMRYGILRDATLATVAALACCLVATLLLVPMLSRSSEVEPTTWEATA